MIVIVPDASRKDLNNFVRKLYRITLQFRILLILSPALLMSSTLLFLLPPTEPVDSSELDKRDKQHHLDMIKVSLSLLKHQLNEALARKDKSVAMNMMRSIDLNNEEKLRLERDLEAPDTEESFKVKDEDDVDDNNEGAPDAEIENHPGDDDVTLEVKEEIKKEDDDDAQA